MYNLFLNRPKCVFTFLCFIMLSFLFLPKELAAQKKDKVEVEDFEVELEPGDEDASAVYLHHNVYVQYSFIGDNLILQYYVHDRIKVLTEEGEKYGEFEIPLYDAPLYKEGLKHIKASSYNLENGIIVEAELEKDQIFNENTSKNYRTIKFALPNVKVGTIIDVSYRLDSPQNRSVDRWFFQMEVPVEYSRYEIHVPNNFVMTPIPSGYIELHNEQENYYGKVFNGVKFTIWAENIPALKEDEYVLNIEDYRSSIKYEVSEVNLTSGREKYSSSWYDIAKELYEHQNFGSELNNKLKALDLQVINAMKLEGKDQIKYLYDYVRQNYEWDGFNSVYTNNLNKAVVSKSGNSAEINLLLCNLLIKAGYDAKPAILKTRQRGLLNSKFPGVSDFNYVITEVPFDEEILLLDATEKLIPMGNLPLRATVLHYLLIGKEGGTIKEAQNPNTNNVINMINYKIDVEGEALIGSGKYRYSDYAAVMERSSINEIDNALEDDIIEEGVRENITKTVEVVNADDIYQPITYTFQEELYDEINFIEDKIFIDACLDSRYDQNPFTEETRSFPIFFPYKTKSKRSHQIKIPEGYRVESIPEPMVVKMGEKDGRFIYECKEAYGSIILAISVEISTNVILPEQYEGVKQFYQLMESKHKEKIVLVRI